MPLVEEGLETPIDNFVFRQCPAEFKLKATNSKNEIPSWTEDVDSLPHKSSLIQISHKRGIIFFPHHENGSLGYASIDNLAEKENLSAEFLSFPGDESFISAICLDTSEDFLFVAKGSKIIYAVNLTAEDKRPFYKIKQKLEDVVIECVASEQHEIFVLLQNGKLLNLTVNGLYEIDLFISEIVKGPISCISQVKNDLMAVGSKEKSEIYLINLEKEEISFKTISLKDLGFGSIGISSIFLFEDENTLLFSCFPENPENDDVPLLLLENSSNEAEMKISSFFDPCASRPPRQNQFYFHTLPISKWADNLVDLVVVGNYASPDLGICGRLEVGGEFQTFFIDNDEGLAQLPFINGEVTFPLGLALDLSSKTFLDNLKDPEGETHPPAPIIWVLTNSAHLCPFSMVKTDETEPFSFMKQVPSVIFPSKAFEEISSEELESYSTSEFESEEEQSQTLSPVAAVSAATPQTPSKIPLQQLASLQKSAEIKPIESAGMFSFKPAPSISEPAKPIKASEPAKPASNPTAKIQSSPKPVAAVEPIEPVPVLVKKEEMMETINVSSYQNILLAEVAATHAAMQEDLFSLRQLSLKNSLLLRQNSQKYFNSLESLETYATTLEKLLTSSDKVFLGVNDRLDELKIDLKELMMKMKQVKSTWNRIKQDNKINWDSRVKALSMASKDLFERIDRLRSFMSNPIEAAKYRATLKSFVDSTQEKVQLLMAHLSNLFVSQNEDISTIFSDFGGLSLSSSFSSGNLLDQLEVLSLEGSRESLSDSREKAEKRNKSLLNAAKARGSRLLIPKKFTPISPAQTDAKHLKLTPEDESLISSFISAINLTEEVPEFAETAILAKLTLEDKGADAASGKTSVAPVAATKPVVEAKAFELKPIAEPKPFVFKPVAESKPFEFKVTETKPTAPKPFEFNPAESKPFEFKPAETKASESKPFEFKPAETKASESKALEFKPSSSPANSNGLFSFSSVTNDKPETASPAAAFSFKPLESKDTTTTSSPTISTVSTVSDSPTVSAESEASAVSVKSESSNASETSIKSESIKETPKIPSIFTMTSQLAVAKHESILAKESPLPTFDSLNFGSDVKEEKSEGVKPFPSIFGVKLAEKEEDKSQSAESETTAKGQSEAPKSESTSFFSFSSPSISTASEKKDELVAAAPSVQGFSFSFKPEISSTESVKESVEEIVSETVKETIKESTPEPSPSLPLSPALAASPVTEIAPKPTLSFSFAPNAEKSPVQSASSGFSITTKPTFGAPSEPVFGSTSIPSATAAPVFGSTSIPAAPVFGTSSLPSAPFGSVPLAFGQTSFPSASFNALAPVPASSSGSSGFAAFAAASNQGSTGFSAFAAPQVNNGNGLTFASFLPADKDKKKEEKQGSGGAPSSFSFTGFRE